MTDPNHDVVSGEEHARVKAQLARVEAVLADLLNERRGTNALQVEMLTWLRNAETLCTFLEDVEPGTSTTTRRRGACAASATNPRRQPLLRARCATC
jgi:hypothetical protein